MDPPVEWVVVSAPRATPPPLLSYCPAPSPVLLCPYQDEEEGVVFPGSSPSQTLGRGTAHHKYCSIQPHTITVAGASPCCYQYMDRVANTTESLVA